MSIVTSFELRKYRATKIVATIGPRSREPAQVRALIGAGVDVFRVNMSHGTHVEHAAAIATIRHEAAKLGTHTAILADLCGPKIRMGQFAVTPLTLLRDAATTITTRAVVGHAGLISSQYAGLATDVRPGDRILLNDGAAELTVLSIAGTEVRCRVVQGGVIGDHKGINLPGVQVSAPSLTDKDRLDAQFALAQAVDFIALSFVRERADVDSLLDLLGPAETRPAVIAKIEKPEALANSAAILAAADGIMVARGDLGVELPPEQVPAAQRQLIRLAGRHDKQVIVATQMLESMIANARPTRAEVTDVSNAVASGADAVMLSGETAVGAFAVETVEIMSRIVYQTEAYQLHSRRRGVRAALAAAHGEVSAGDAVASATAQLVADTQACAVVVITSRGVTAATVCAARPAAPVVVVSAEPATCRRMSLLWGAVPMLDPATGQDHPNVLARRAVQRAGLAGPGDFIVLVRGFHADRELNTPTITLLSV
ncbi:MAG: pyruvate kinase [Gammaproteobacteria bacterium]|nr:pyruvate kinase [Gammaproteobacteria bacterium]